MNTTGEQAGAGMAAEIQGRLPSLQSHAYMLIDASFPCLKEKLQSTFSSFPNTATWKAKEMKKTSFFSGPLKLEIYKLKNKMIQVHK